MPSSCCNFPVRVSTGSEGTSCHICLRCHAPCDDVLKDDSAKPCPHGRLPMNKHDGWKHCPHCLGLNDTKPMIETSEYAVLPWWYSQGESIANGADAYSVIEKIVAEAETRVIKRIESMVEKEAKSWSAPTDKPSLCHDLLSQLQELKK